MLKALASRRALVGLIGLLAVAVPVLLSGAASADHGSLATLLFTNDADEPLQYVVLPDIGAEIDDAETQHVMGLFVFEAPTVTQHTQVGYGFGTGLLTQGV